jgi:hypothetical protein
MESRKLTKETKITILGCEVLLQIDSSTVHTSFGSEYIFLQAEKALENLMKNSVQMIEPEPTELEKAAWDGIDSCGSESCDQEKADSFIAGAKWLAERLLGLSDHAAINFPTPYQYYVYVKANLEQLTKTRE